MELNCNKCGRCCEEITINVSQTDILRWKEEERKDILQEVSWLHNYPRKNTGGFYIIKTTFNPKQACPFYNGACLIHNTKPKACKDYPFSQTEFFSECFMFGLDGMFPLKKKRIKKSQAKDFKKAFDNQGRLMPILIEARR